MKVECTGFSIGLHGANSNIGWSIEVDDRGPARVRVEFESNDGDRRTRVEATCPGGNPVFGVDTRLARPRGGRYGPAKWEIWPREVGDMAPRGHFLPPRRAFSPTSEGAFSHFAGGVGGRA